MNGKLLAAYSTALLLSGCTTIPQVGGVEVGRVRTGDGADLYYEKSGTGRQVVIAPGGLFLEPWLRPLDASVTYIAYDPRSRGQSSKVPDPARTGVLRDLEDIESVRRHFRLERVSLVGWSYLGGVAAAYALRHPDRVDRLVLIGPAPFDFKITYEPAHRADGAVAHLDPTERRRIGLLKAQGFHVREPHEFCRLQVGWWAKEMTGDASGAAVASEFVKRSCASENEWPVNFYPHADRIGATYASLGLSAAEAAAIKAPTLVVHGTQDRNAAFGSGVDWAYHIPRARLLRVDGAAHLVVAERPAVVDEIRAFLTGRWPPEAYKPDAAPARTPLTVQDPMKK